MVCQWDAELASQRWVTQKTRWCLVTTLALPSLLLCNLRQHGSITSRLDLHLLSQEPLAEA